MSSDPSYPQDRPTGPPTEPVPQAPPYARPPEQAYPEPSYPQQSTQPPYQSYQSYQGSQPYAPAPDGRITFQPPGPAVEHPQATLAFVLGLLSILGLLILGPFGWYFGRKVIREIDHDPRTFSNRGLAMAGMVLGIVATAFMALLAVLFGVGVVLVMAGSSR